MRRNRERENGKRRKKERKEEFERSKILFWNVRGCSRTIERFFQYNRTIEGAR